MYSLCLRAEKCMLKQRTVSRSGKVTTVVAIRTLQSVICCVPCEPYTLENKLINLGACIDITQKSVYKQFSVLEDVSSSCMIKKFYVFSLIQRRLSEKNDLIPSEPLNVFSKRMSSQKNHFFCLSKSYELSGRTTWGSFVSFVIKNKHKRKI